MKLLRTGSSDIVTKQKLQGKMEKQGAAPCSTICQPYTPPSPTPCGSICVLYCVGK